MLEPAPGSLYSVGPRIRAGAPKGEPDMSIPPDRLSNLESFHTAPLLSPTGSQRSISERDSTVERPSFEDPTRQPVGPSPRLKALCESLARPEPRSGSGLFSLAGPFRRNDLARTLGAAAKCEVQKLKLRGGPRELLDELKDYQGPVIVLGADRKPAYVFERRDDQWQGYHAIDFSPLPPELSSPHELLASKLRDNPGGVFFSAYRLDLRYDPQGQDPVEDLPTRTPAPPLVIDLERDHA